MSVVFTFVKYTKQRTVRTYVADLCDKHLMYIRTTDNDNYVQTR